MRAAGGPGAPVVAGTVLTDEAELGDLGLQLGGAHPMVDSL